jgi:hypothetical protein
VWCTIGITFKRNGWHRDDRTFDKPLFQIVIFRIGFNQAELAFSAFDIAVLLFDVVRWGGTTTHVRRAVVHRTTLTDRAPRRSLN